MNQFDKILCIYSDESFQSRFKSICAVSGYKENLDNLKNKLVGILEEFQVKELKFIDVRTHSNKIDCCIEFINTSIDFAAEKLIRIDVLIWDIEDSRHKISGRDEKENLERMYFHLLRNVIERWNIINCEFYPDEHTEFEYKKIIDYLNLTKTPRTEPSIITLFKQERINFNFTKVESQKSNENHLIQLCDIFAGFASFSRERSKEFKSWNIKKKDKNNLTLFDDQNSDEDENAKSTTKRFEIIEHISNKCKNRNISISLNTNNYLKTYDKNLSINFWHYEPQGDYDKAPTKRKRN